MIFKLAVMGVTGMSAAGICRTASAQEKLQWDGVYTQDQAGRGQALFEPKCVICHEHDLRGTGLGRALCATNSAPSGMASRWANCSTEFDKRSRGTIREA